MTILSNGCVEEFKVDLEQSRRKLLRYLQYMFANNMITEEKFEKTKEVCKSLTDRVGHHPLEFGFLMKYFGIRKYNSVDIVEFVRFFSGKLPATGVDYAYLNHPSRYELLRRIAYVLQEESLLDERDKLKLFLGRSWQPKNTYNFVKLEDEDGFKVWKDDTLIYKVEGESAVKSLEIGRKFLAGEDVGSFIEMSYLRKGVLVYYKL